jgi:hypothetical protein
MDSLTSSDDQPIPPAKPQPQVPTGVSSPTDKTSAQWTVLETQTEETPNDDGSAFSLMLCTPSGLYAQQTWVCSNSVFLLVPVGVCAEQPLHAAHNIEWIRQRRTQWLSETPRETPTHGLYKSLPLRSWSKGNRTENLWHPKSTVVWFLLDVSICNYM